MDKIRLISFKFGALKKTVEPQNMGLKMQENSRCGW